MSTGAKCVKITIFSFQNKHKLIQWYNQAVEKLALFWKSGCDLQKFASLLPGAADFCLWLFRLFRPLPFTLMILISKKSENFSLKKSHKHSEQQKKQQNQTLCTALSGRKTWNNSIYLSLNLSSPKTLPTDFSSLYDIRHPKPLRSCKGLFKTSLNRTLLTCHKIFSAFP